MGEMKNFVEDFLDVVNNDMRETYRHKEWDWENLPDVEVMFEVMRRHDEIKGKQK